MYPPSALTIWNGPSPIEFATHPAKRGCSRPMSLVPSPPAAKLRSHRIRGRVDWISTAIFSSRSFTRTQGVELNR